MTGPIVADPTATLDEVRASFRRWLADNSTVLAPYRTEPVGDLADSFAHFHGLQRLLCDAGWTRLGWPESMGGLGGSSLQRALVLDELAASGQALPGGLGSVEIIAPMLVGYAQWLAAVHLVPGLRGDEVWCQGFSEPDAGSDLGSLRTRAVPDGEGHRINGQKMWTSNGHIARYSAVLARTGDDERGYRGLTMFWVDLHSPGVTVRPTACESGRSEVSEVFLDDVKVGPEHVVGGVGEGWAVVMYLLQFERGAYAWQRQAELLTQLEELLDHVSHGDSGTTADLVGSTYLGLLALRARCSATLAALDSGRQLGPEISIDKLLLSSAEQTLTDTARTVLWPALEIDDDEAAEAWRRRWTFSRITTIYGGAAEVQRDLVAERLLGLPRGR